MTRRATFSVLGKTGGLFAKKKLAVTPTHHHGLEPNVLHGDNHSEGRPPEHDLVGYHTTPTQGRRQLTESSSQKGLAETSIAARRAPVGSQGRSKRHLTERL